MDDPRIAAAVIAGAVSLVLVLAGGVAFWLRTEQVRQEGERRRHEAELAQAVEADLARLLTEVAIQRLEQIGPVGEVAGIDEFVLQAAP